MSQPTRNVQCLRPTYGGESKKLPESVQINQYFKVTDISCWNLSDFLICTGLSEITFIEYLLAINKIKRLPQEITKFAYALCMHYEGELGAEKIKLARTNARKELGSLVVNSMERVSAIKVVENELDLEIAEGRPAQAEPCRPLFVPSLSTSLHSASSRKKSSASLSTFPNAGTASSSRNTSSVYGDTTAETSTKDENESLRTTSTHIQTAITAATTSATGKSTRASRKKRKTECITEEPWRSLLVALQQIVNGQQNVSFPVAPAGMLSVHKLLFDHAVDAMKSYLAQPIEGRDVLLLKDAQCSMSCVLNTMSAHVGVFLEESDEEELFVTAKNHCLVVGFKDHACNAILVEYLPVLQEKGVEYLRLRLMVDRGKLASDYLDEPSLPPTAMLRDQILHILLEICDHILHPPYGKLAPSESDCLHYWVRVFSILVKQVTIQTGEKALGATKVIRRQQTAEYGEVSEAGRKVDCIFAFKKIELSNVEFKLRGAMDKEVAVQNRKNIRLARALQEAHARHGAGDVSVLMADVAGFVGTFYQVCPMGDIHTAGRTADSAVFLPHTPGSLELFLQSKSLAIICNYIAKLEAQGVDLSKAYDLHDSQQELQQHADGLALGRPRTPPHQSTKIRSNVVLTPSKRRIL
ncbi:hypothetical protein BGZ73_006961 [Actinomortierella ambigua]|nr:hypothetical protein BGZ73_006961 [Actinomortierella ambigua]